MFNLILQRFAPLLTAFALFINSIGGFFGISAVIPYNPERTEVVVSGDVTTDINKVLEHYNSAVKKTGFVIGTSTTEIIGTPSASANDDTTIDMDAYWDSIEDIETYTFKIPGNGEILASDVKSAGMSVNNGKRAIILKIKDTKRSGESNDAVLRAYGWTSDFDKIGAMLGMTVEGGQIKESYTDCTVSCIIDEKNGKIIYGDWDATGTISIKDIKVKMFGFEELTMDMDYTAKQRIDI